MKGDGVSLYLSIGCTSLREGREAKIRDEVQERVHTKHLTSHKRAT